MLHLQKHESEIAIVSIVRHELLFGCYSLPQSRKRLAIEAYLNAIDWFILPYDANAADWHAKE